MSFWRIWKYKNLTLWFLSIVFLAILFRNEPFRDILLTFGDFGYIGALVAGILFVSTFTVSLGALLLFALAQRMSPLEIGLIAGYGAVLGDYVIFRFVRNNLVDEIAYVYEKFGGKHISSVLHTKYFSWTLPVLGAFIIASPLPDELGVSLMGIAKMKPYKFLLLSFLLNTLGIFLVVSASALISP